MPLAQRGRSPKKVFAHFLRKSGGSARVKPSQPTCASWMGANRPQTPCLRASRRGRLALKILLGNSIKHGARLHYRSHPTLTILRRPLAQRGRSPKKVFAHFLRKSGGSVRVKPSQPTLAWDSTPHNSYMYLLRLLDTPLKLNYYIINIVIQLAATTISVSYV